MATKDKEKTKKEFEAEEAEKKQKVLEKEKEQAQSKTVKDKEQSDKELEALQKGDFKFIDSKSELEYLAMFMKSAKIPDGTQMSSLDKQKAKAAATIWYTKAKKTLDAS